MKNNGTIYGIITYYTYDSNNGEYLVKINNKYFKDKLINLNLVKICKKIKIDKKYLFMDEWVMNYHKKNFYITYHN